MRDIQAAIVAFDKPYFIYNAKGIKVLPTIVAAGSEAIDSLLIGDLFFQSDSEEALMAEFDRLGFTMPEENPWEFGQNIRLFLSDQDLLDLFSLYPELTGFIEAVKDTTVKRNGGRWIYLSELYPQHKLLFESYPSFIYEEK